MKEQVFQALLLLELAELGYSAPLGSLPYEERFALLLKKVRRFRGLSQGQLAALSKVNITTISHLERGQQRPQPVTVDALARALRVPPERLDPDQLTPDQVIQWWETAAKELSELLQREIQPADVPEVRGQLQQQLGREIQARRQNEAAIEQENRRE